MKIKLSVCIPTLNRGKFIGETLDSIVSQATDGVEIVIVDGGSKDETADVVLSYLAKFPSLRYYRPKNENPTHGVIHPSNKGYDQDCNRAIGLAKGEYCWILPDDDLIKPNAINKILEELNNNYSLVVVNSELKNHDLTQIIQNKLLNIENNEIYSDLENLFTRTIQYISYAGCVVVNRNLWLERERSNYFGTAFVHVGVIFQAPLPAPALIISEPLISIRYGNAHWTSRAFEIGVISYPSLIATFENISKASRNKLTLVSPLSGLISIAIYRAKKQYSLEHFYKFKRLNFSCRLCRFITFIIAVTPTFLIRFALLTIAKAFVKDKKILIYDLKHN